MKAIERAELSLKNKFPDHSVRATTEGDKVSFLFRVKKGLEYRHFFRSFAIEVNLSNTERLEDAVSKQAETKLNIG